LGHLVGKVNVRVDHKNIEYMKDWPHPKNLKILHGFLGLTGYYRKFVRNYGKIATPLTALLEKNSFTWNPTTAQHFQTLKMAVCTTPFMALPDFTKTFVLECGKELAPSLWKRVGLWPLPTNNCLSAIWENQSMKRKCWLFFMLWIFGALIYWGNASKLRHIIKASSIFWNNVIHPQSNKNG
jgi:hypothetical protein